MLERLTDDEQHFTVLLVFVAINALCNNKRTAYNFGMRVRELMDDGVTMTPEKFDEYQKKLNQFLYELKEVQ